MIKYPNDAPKYNVRPPLGITPRYIHDERRYAELREVIMERAVRHYPIQKEWVEEFNELLQRIDVK